MSACKHSLHHSKGSSAKALRSLKNAGIVLLCSGVSLVSAQQLVDISSCTRIADDKERFACYDNLARAAGALPSTPAAAVAVPAAPVTTAPVVTAPAPSVPAPATRSTASPASATPAPAAPVTDSARIAAFGNASQPRIEAGARGEEMLIDTVTSAKFYKPDVWQLTLSSGQVWRQMIDGRFLLRVGDKVHITPNPWGDSYRLVVEGRNGFIQVEKLANK